MTDFSKIDNPYKENLLQIHILLSQAKYQKHISRWILTILIQPVKFFPL
jgi:hypothetical protein